MPGCRTSGYATNEDTATGTGTYTQDYRIPTSPGSRLPRRGARIALIAVGAVVIGAVVGLGGTLVAQLARTEAADTPTPAPTGAPTGAATPAAQNPTPPADAASAPPQSPNINNPEIAPEITAVTQTGASVLVEWQDATDGVAQFVVVRVVDGTGEPVRAMPPGITEVVIDGLDEASGPHCFLVIAVVGSDRGVSTTRCTGE